MEENEETEQEVESLEFSLDQEEIDELIQLLQNLKTTKEKFAFDIDEEHELIIHYQEQE